MPEDLNASFGCYYIFSCSDGLTPVTSGMHYRGENSNMHNSDARADLYCILQRISFPEFQTPIKVQPHDKLTQQFFAKGGLSYEDRLKVEL